MDDRTGETWKVAEHPLRMHRTVIVGRAANSWGSVLSIANNVGRSACAAWTHSSAGRVLRTVNE